MYVYNQEKINVVKEKLGFENLSNDELCKEIFKMVSERKIPNNFMSIDYGSARSAYWLEDTDIVIKVSYLIEDYDNEICFQGDIERYTYEKYKENKMCYNIYGMSDNCAVIICEELDTELSVENLMEYGLDDLLHYLQYEVNVEPEYLYDEDDFYSFLSDYLEDYLIDREYDIFTEDFHINNVGIGPNGEIKILDLGYGDLAGESAEKATLDVLRKGKIARGSKAFYSGSSNRLKFFKNKYKEIGVDLDEIMA